MEHSDANRLGLDYRRLPARRGPTPRVDAHTHLHDGPHLPAFIEAADLYGIGRIMSMTPLRDVDALAARLGRRVGFIAIPRWEKAGNSEEFRAGWQRDLAEFRRRGAWWCKFWMAPPMRERGGITLDGEFVRPIVDTALDLGFHFLVHVGDPTVWWRSGGKYADTRVFGTKEQQYEQLHWFAEYIGPRRVVAAHMGGNVEDCDFLQGLLDRHANLSLDSSATKWIVREVARQPQRVRQFLLRNADRVLFGSDLVASPNYGTFEHYASRYWAHQMMWESNYRGESPIHDPDADDPPRLAGLELPEDVLSKMYVDNFAALEDAASGTGPE